MFVGKDENVPVSFRDDNGAIDLNGKKVEILIGKPLEADRDTGDRCIHTDEQTPATSTTTVTFVVPKSVTNQFDGAHKVYSARFKVDGERTHLIPIKALD